MSTPQPTRPTREEKLEAARRRLENPTPAEAALWRMLAHGQLGATFEREREIQGYWADFACPTHRLIVEVDGGYHADPAQVIADRERGIRLKAQGWRTIRFSNAQVLDDVAGVSLSIVRALRRISEGKPKTKRKRLEEAPTRPRLERVQVKAKNVRPGESIHRVCGCLGTLDDLTFRPTTRCCRHDGRTKRSPYSIGAGAGPVPPGELVKVLSMVAPRAER